MKPNPVIHLLLLTVLFSCGHTPPDKATSAANGKSPQATAFAAYLQHFRKLELPIVIKGCAITTDGLHEFDGKTFNQYTDEYSLAYGQIPTNGNYVATLTLGAADCYLPILATYTPDGQPIAKQTIAIGGCGSDCGFSCEEFMTLRADFSFYTSDTVSVYCCDSLGNEIPGTYEYYVIYQQGKLLPNGNIYLTKERKQPLPGRKVDGR